MKVLFIHKICENYGCGSQRSSGLYNSAMFCAQMLCASGMEAKVIQVVDNNDIDREVSRYQPTHVIIEALWVVPEKFAVLCPLHPQVKWIVRIHSKLPFLANEGIAVDWLFRYTRCPKVFIAFNDRQTRQDFIQLTLRQREALYLPNYYQAPFTKRHPSTAGILNVGCLGAVRPLKNHLIQAVAAIHGADELGKTLRFHINSSRVEMHGENILKNLQALFAHSLPHQLIEHPWLEPADVFRLLSYLDVGLQVSLSETFNIVAADLVSAGVPIVVSAEVPWASKLSIASTGDAQDIKNKMLRALRWPFVNVQRNRQKLMAYAKDSREWWMKELEDRG